MISHKYETIVGLFVVASLAGLMIMVMIIAQQEGLWEERVNYRAVFRNISGLKKGSEVRLSGVTVGNVQDITIDSKGNIQVNFEVYGKYRDQVRQDSKATIGFIGLLGDRSLDLTAGSPEKPAVPPDGLVAAVEPFDFTEIVNRATPYLENLQKLLNNTVALTEVLKEPQGDFRQLLASLKDLSQKINKGQGSLGLLVNDPALYREAVKTVGNIGKLTDSLGKSEGLLGTLIHDKAFSAEAKKTLGEMRTLLSNLQRSTVPVEEAAARLPELVKKAEAFLTNLERASAGLPDLVVTGQTAVGDVEQVAEAAKKSWLLRPYVPKPEERTIRVEKDIR